jgi:flagellar biosynthesis repressor protein FlbT
MTASLRLSLKSGEKIYINGAVLRVDRKVTMELLNEATFLLAQHIIKADETKTPLRQLYFLVQTLLIDPASGEKIRPMCRDSLSLLASAFENRDILDGLLQVSQFLQAGRLVDALKCLRKLFPIEATILPSSSTEVVGTAGPFVQSVEHSTEHREVLACKS